METETDVAVRVESPVESGARQETIIELGTRAVRDINDYDVDGAAHTELHV